MKLLSVIQTGNIRTWVKRGVILDVDRERQGLNGERTAVGERGESVSERWFGTER